MREVDLPIDQRLTLQSSPPVIRNRDVFFPILRQFTFAECAKNSSFFFFFYKLSQVITQEQIIYRQK